MVSPWSIDYAVGSSRRWSLMTQMLISTNQSNVAPTSANRFNYFADWNPAGGLKASGLASAFTMAAAEYSRTEETKKYAIFRRGLRFLSTRGRIYHLVEILGHGMPLRLILGTNAKKGARSWKWRILLRTCIPLWFEIAAEGNLSELDMMVYYLLRRNWNWKLVLSEVRSYVHDSVLLRLASDDCTKPRAPSESS